LPQALAKNLAPHCRRIAAQRAAGEADLPTLKLQLRPSAWTPGLAALPSAAKAALVALMQHTSSAAAKISIINLMARSFRTCFVAISRSSWHHSSDRTWIEFGKAAQYLHENDGPRCKMAPSEPVSIQA
jgi:hypothetical protein